MSQEKLKKVTFTKEAALGAGADGLPLQEIHFGGAEVSLSDKLEEDPRKTGRTGIFGYLRAGRDFSLSITWPAVFNGARPHLDANLRNTFPSAPTTVTLSDLTFSAAENTVATATGSFAGFKDLVGHTVEIAGDGTLANRTFRLDENGNPVVLRRVALLSSVETGAGTEKLYFDTDFMQLADEGPGDAVTFVALGQTDGQVDPRYNSRSYEEELGDQLLSTIKGSNISVTAPDTLTGPPGTFDGFKTFQDDFQDLPLNAVGFSNPANNTGLDSPLRVATVAGDGSSITVTGAALVTEAAGNQVVIKLGGSFFSLAGLIAKRIGFDMKNEGGVEFTAEYESVGIKDQNVLTTRSRGDGTTVPAPGAGNAWFGAADIHALFLAEVPGIHGELGQEPVQLAGSEYFNNAKFSLSQELKMERVPGDTRRLKVTSEKTMTEGGASTKFDQKISHRLERWQANKTVLRGIWRFVMPEGAINIQFTSILADGQRKGTGETMLDVTFKGQENPLDHNTVVWDEIPAP